MMDFVSKMMDFVLQMMVFVLHLRLRESARIGWVRRVGKSNTEFIILNAKSIISNKSSSFKNTQFNIYDEHFTQTRAQAPTKNHRFK